MQPLPNYPGYSLDSFPSSQPLESGKPYTYLVDINNIVKEFITALQNSHTDFKQFVNEQVGSVKLEVKEVRQQIEEVKNKIHSIEIKLSQTETKLTKEIDEAKSSLYKLIIGAVILQGAIALILKYALK